MKPLRRYIQDKKMIQAHFQYTKDAVLRKVYLNAIMHCDRKINRIVEGTLRIISF